MKEILGYEGKYLVDKSGNVYSRLKNRLLKPCKSVRGYVVVTLNKKTRTVHQLVAETFIDQDYKVKKLIIDHIDRDKTNNNLSNLRIASKSDNYKNSDYYDNRKKGSIFLRINGNFRVRLSHNSFKFDRTFKTKEEADYYLKEIRKTLF